MGAAGVAACVDVFGLETHDALLSSSCFTASWLELTQRWNLHRCSSLVRASKAPVVAYSGRSVHWFIDGTHGKWVGLNLVIF